MRLWRLTKRELLPLATPLTFAFGLPKLAPVRAYITETELPRRSLFFRALHSCSYLCTAPALLPDSMSSTTTTMLMPLDMKAVNLSLASKPAALTVDTSQLEDLPPNVYMDTPGTPREVLRTRYRDVSSSPRSGSRTPPRRSPFVDPEKADLPFLIAQFGGASSTTWLESRYKIWRGEQSTDERPRIQGYLNPKDSHWAFAWGDPLSLETHEEMKAAAEEMWAWAKSQRLHLVWCCISDVFAEVLAEGLGPKGKKWSTLSCIREDVLRESSFGN